MKKIITESKLPNVKTSIFSVMSAMANEYNAINLSQGFPDYETDVKLSELVFQFMKAGYNQYAPMAGVRKLRQSIADKVSFLYQKDLNIDTEITITAGATQALYTAITAFVGYKDEVIVIEPCYDSYIPSIQVNGGIPVPYKLKGPDFSIDWDELTQLITTQTKMIIINTPNNPSTTILGREDMIALEAILNKNDQIILLSDEVYEHIVFEGEKHHSVLAYPSLYERSMTVFSFGKLFHTTGWKVGYAIGPEKLMSEFRKVHQFNVFSVNTPVQYALAEYLNINKNYLDLPSFFEKKKSILEEQLESTKFNVLPSKGSYFLLVDYSELSDENDEDYAAYLVKKYGVATIPISPFYSTPNDQRLLRLCFAKKDETLLLAGEKLQLVI